MILWCLVCMKTLRSVSKETTEKRLGRSLSEAHSEAEYSNKLNKRFDQAQTIEEEESKGSTDTLVKRSNGVQRSHASSGEFLSSYF